MLYEEASPLLQHALDSVKPDEKYVQTSSCSLNPSSIITRVMQVCARFSEDYTSDAMYGLRDAMDACDTINEAAKAYPGSEKNTAQHHVFFFGVRKNGVDGNTFLTSRLCNAARTPCGWNKSMTDAEKTYRAILAIEMSWDPEQRIARIDLKDLMQELDCVDNELITASS